MSAASDIDVAEAILDAATRLFAQGGYDGTSLKSIADEVGVRKPSLLYHYSSKEALRLAVLRRVFTRWNDVFPRILQAATTGEDRFEGLVGEVVGFFSEEPNRARLILREMLDRPKNLAAQMHEYVTPWVKIVTDYIERGLESGTIRESIDPQAYVLHVIQMIVGGIATAGVLSPRTIDGEIDMERHVRETIRIAHDSLFIQVPHANDSND